MRTLAHLISLTLAVGCATAIAADRPADTAKASATMESRTTAADNASGAAPMAKTSRTTDRKTLAAVRRAVVGDKSLSMAAHNVKMKANGGVVTLRGGVRSAEEKDKIEAHAKSVAGVASVDNQLTLKGEKTARAATAKTSKTQ